ncbi:hypothetical protein BC830DRAFT_884275 [Chytriomyces sp. MP71]|nr:hypothetical protein BC830DRAFT_884275 [Chytriomyces sp. MP71]
MGHLPGSTSQCQIVQEVTFRNELSPTYVGPRQCTQRLGHSLVSLTNKKFKSSAVGADAYLAYLRLTFKRRVELAATSLPFSDLDACLFALFLRAFWVADSWLRALPKTEFVNVDKESLKKVKIMLNNIHILGPTISDNYLCGVKSGSGLSPVGWLKSQKE